MSETIPEDIVKAGRRCYDALGRGSIADSERIARAILAERERCAKIAEDNNHWPAESEFIAGLIRTPDALP